MILNGWKFDFNSLPHWDVRTKVPHVYDLLYENVRMDMAFVIYSIVEYRMGTYAGFLAVLRNKKKPELALRVEKGCFSNSKVEFSMDGKLAFAQSDLWDGGWPIFVFDLSNQRFACFKTVTNNSCFTVKEIKPNKFAIVADKWQMKNDPTGLLKKLHGTIIEPDVLQWMPLSEIDSFCTRFQKSYNRRNFFKKIRKFLLG